MVEIKELSFFDSQSYLNRFQLLEKAYGADWYGAEDENATYIWLIEDINKPLGFLSYKVLILPNRIDFVYIVKIYVLKSHRGNNPILVEDERVSKILFRQIDRKDVNILTLESACKELDVYYKSLEFKYNEEISNKFSKIIGISEKIMYKQKKDIELSDEEKIFFSKE